LALRTAIATGVTATIGASDSNDRRKCREWRLWVKDQRDPLKARRHLLEQSQPFAGDGRLIGGEPGDVATRPCQARNDSAANRIRNAYEDGRDRASGLPQRLGRDRVGGDDNVRREPNEFFRVSPGEVRVDGAPAIVDAQVVALAPTQCLEFRAEHCRARLGVWIVFEPGHQDGDSSHAIKLLRPRRARPRRCRAAEKSDELAPLQSIELHSAAPANAEAAYRIEENQVIARCVTGFRTGD
jgi:hypothetical protein